MFDGKQLGVLIVAQVREFVGKTMSTLSGRVEALEKREPLSGPQGEPGKDGKNGLDADPQRIDEAVQKAFSALPIPKDGRDGKDGLDGKDADPEVIQVAVHRAVSAIPIPKDGKDGQPGKGAYQLAVERGFTGTELQWLDSLQGGPGRDGKDGSDGLPGRDGMDGKHAEVDYDRIGNAIRDVVRVAVDEIPKPKDGKDADPEQIAAAVTRAVSKIPTPKDGRDADPAEIAAAVERGIAAALPAAVERAVTALLPTIIKSAADAVPRPENGKDADPEQIRMVVRHEFAALEARTAQQIAAIPVPKDGEDGTPGKDADEAAILARVTEHMLRAVDALPKPKDGRDGQDARAPDLDDLVAKVLAMVPVPRDGKDADESAIVERVRTLIPAPRDGIDGKDVDEDAIVERVVSRIPVPKDGRDGVDGKDADIDEIAASVFAAIPEVRNGRDGVDGASLTIEDIRPLLEAETARWQVEFERRANDALNAVVEKMPRPADGKDGLSIDDFDVTLDGRILTLSLRCGERLVEKQIKVSFPVDCGVYRAGKSYEKGDVVTFGGSQWIALKDNATKPPSDDWRCQVQRGRDGKDAE